MSSTIISIIVPVYNVEEFLRRCIESLLCQTYKNIEILLIDDGSTDASGDICDMYRVVDNRIKVIHKENAGVTKARMAGLEVCNGDYVTFIDSDDYVEERFIEKLYSAIVEHQVKASFCQVIYKYENHDVFHVRNEVGYFDRQRLDEMLSTDFLFDYTHKEPGIFLGQCGKLFAKDLVIKSIKQSEGLWVGEDLIMILHMLYYISSLYISSESLYYYTQHSGQATRKSNDAFWDNIVCHWEKVVEIDCKCFLKNQLPYRILQNFEVYVRNIIEDKILYRDFKVKIERALSYQIVMTYLLNYEFRNLTIADSVFMRLIRCNCFRLLFHLSIIANCVYKFKRKFIK